MYKLYGLQYQLVDVFFFFDYLIQYFGSVIVYSLDYCFIGDINVYQVVLI